MTSFKLLILLTFTIFSAFAEDIGSPFIFETQSPHKISILNHGSLSLKKRLDMIESAKKSIEVEYFIFRRDDAGKFMLSALIKKARQGVRVRVLFDKFLVKKTMNKYILAYLKKENVEVRFFNTLPNIFFNRAQYRNHRKSLIVDDEKAIIGGRNIGNEYFDLDKSYNFIDRDLYVEGSIVKVVRESFDRFWTSDFTKEIKPAKKPQMSVFINSDRSFHEEQQHKSRVRYYEKHMRKASDFLYTIDKSNVLLQLKNFWHGMSEEDLKKDEYTCDDLAYYSDMPSVGRKKTDRARVLKYQVFDLIKEARESVFIESPYFIMDKDMRESIENALARNIDLKVLTNGLYASDAIYVGSRLYDAVRTWLKLGLDLFLVKGSIFKEYPVFNSIFKKVRWGTHAKTIIVDEKTSVVGTYNIDPRSNNYNMEHALVCRDNFEVAQAIKDSVQVRMESARFMKDQNTFSKLKWEKIDASKKFLYYLVKIPAILFNHLL